MQRKLCLFRTFKISCIVTYTTIKHFPAQFVIVIVNKLNKILHRQHICRKKRIQGGGWSKKKYNYTYNSYWEITNLNSLYYTTFEYAVYFHPHYRIISLTSQHANCKLYWNEMRSNFQLTLHTLFVWCMETTRYCNRQYWFIHVHLALHY